MSMSLKLSDVLEKIDEGYMHYCDGCDSYHMINVDKPNEYSGARWTYNGNPESPTFEPSINIVGVCHYYITNGNISYCNDSKHSIAGKTLPLPKIPD